MYYYIPLNVYQFIVGDCYTNKMLPYVYLKGEENNGGKNVASFLMWNPKQCGLSANFKPNPGDACKGIDLFFDNYYEQNKSRVVILLLIFMVGRKMYKTFRTIFLVRGHTKNDLDR